ncbi:hypothetical protein BCV69DRAFT_313710 [Microstroma glucosiphilum]|uniref:MFS general substrate transporter n=1 Tax=Pseudomicrostroma glucosiphilum TaxID=1684307 RepID=A0A316U8Z3_9BASI|nr:hypothetical protein BCV69DRAFT_313710 [Pseudomicrostroma glucosiphilum]PWN19455.1 hypothetical protein BCV69DRAFT_313710 [Pseudomicrostroma glucosiphilum]
MQDQLPTRRSQSIAIGMINLQPSPGPVLLRPWLGEDSLDSSHSHQAVPHILSDDSVSSAFATEGGCALPRMGPVAFGESAAGRPSSPHSKGKTGTHDQAIEAPCTHARSALKPVPPVSTKQHEDHGLTDCHHVSVQPINLLELTPQSSHVCRDCGKEAKWTVNGSQSAILQRASLLLCLAFAVLIFQVMDAGGAHVILAHQDPLTKTALSGRIAFLVGQSIGSFIGCSLHSMGKWALLVDLALANVFATLAGTSSSYIVLDVFRGLTGVTSGIFLSLVLIDLRCLMASCIPRSIAALLLLILAAVAQIAGGWLSTLVVHSQHWHWLYWGGSVALFCNICAIVVLVRPRGRPAARPLREAQDGKSAIDPLKGTALVVWLPLTHPHLSLTTLSMAIAACIYVSILATVQFLWKLTFRFSLHRAYLTTTVCLLVSTLLALILATLLGQEQPRRTTEGLPSYDEKATRAAGCRSTLPERTLLHTAVALLVIACSLLLLALATKTTISWVATALLLVIIGTASFLAIDSGLRYVFDIYRPTCDGQGDWGRHYVAAATGSCVGTVIGACAQALMMAPLAFVKLGFSTLACVLACCAFSGAVIAAAVCRLGPGWRKKRWDTIGSHEEGHNGSTQAPRRVPLQVSAPRLQASTYPMTFRGPSLRLNEDVEELDVLKSSTLSASPASGTLYKSNRQQSPFSSSNVDLSSEISEAVGDRRQQSMDNFRSVSGYRI